MSEQIIETVAAPTAIGGVKFSASIARLSMGLAKAQGEFHAVLKDLTAKVRTKTGAEYSYQYADLGSVLEAIRGPLATNGLAVMQPVETSGDKVKVTTILSHESGEWIMSSLIFTVEQAGANPFIPSAGSAITYARRYSLSGLLSIATETDDDGKGAGNSRPQNKQKPFERKQPVRDSAKNPEASTVREIEDHFTGEPELDGEAAGKRVALFLANVCGAKSKEDYTTILRYATSNDQILWDGAKMNAEIMSKVQTQVSDACQIRGVKPSELLASLKSESVSELAGTL